MQAPICPIGPIHLPNGEPLARKNPCQFGTIGARSFDTDCGYRTETGQVVDNLTVSGSYCQKLMVTEAPAKIGDQGNVMGIGVRVDTGDDFELFVFHSGTGWVPW